MKDSQDDYRQSLYRQGMMYVKGHDGYPQNFANAIECFRRAAEEDHAGAQFILGMLLLRKCIISERGEIWDKDWNEAWRWLYRAEGQGLPEAVKLKPSQVDKVQDMRRFWEMMRDFYVPGMEGEDWKAFFDQMRPPSP